MKLKDARIIFMGTSFFAKEILKNLIENEIKIELVVTQSDKPAGRKKELKPSEVKLFAKENDLELKQFLKLDKSALREFEKIKPDLVIIAAYGIIIPASFLEISKYGFINVHTSLLPKLRGASPIQTALLQGLDKTGVTIMKINKGLDSGDIISQKEVRIENSDKYQDLEKKLITASADILTKTLNSYLKNLKTIPQDHIQATFTKIIKKSKGQIDWNFKAKDIWNIFKAYYNWPQIYTFDANGKKLTLVEIGLSQESEEDKKPGEVYRKENQILIKTGLGSIILEKIKLEGKNELNIKDFINGNPNLIGSILK
jgi:methionyl-tRNA formyltransferase